MNYPDGTKLAGEFKDGEFVGEQQQNERKEGKAE